MANAARRPLIGITCSTVILADQPAVERYALPRRYVGCVVDAGGLPFVLPGLAPDAAEEAVERVDALLLSGGIDVDPDAYGQEPRPGLGRVDEERDRFEIAAARAAHRTGKPILAICRGIQVLNVAFGGTLVQDIPTEVAGALRHHQLHVLPTSVSHRVEIEPGSLLHRVLGTDALRVNSFHHQAVDRLATGFVASARAADGVIEGMEDPAHPFCLAVQWHPERRPADPATRALFGRFLEAVGSARASSKEGAPVPR